MEKILIDSKEKDIQKHVDAMNQNAVAANNLIDYWNDIPQFDYLKTETQKRELLKDRIPYLNNVLTTQMIEIKISSKTASPKGIANMFGIDYDLIVSDVNKFRCGDPDNFDYDDKFIPSKKSVDEISEKIKVYASTDYEIKEVKRQRALAKLLDEHFKITGIKVGKKWLAVHLKLDVKLEGKNTYYFKEGFTEIKRQKP